MKNDGTIFVITPTTDLKNLELQNNKFEALPYDMRRMSNDEAIKRYGINNTDMYNILKANILDNQSNDYYEYHDLEDYNSIMSEAFEIDNKYSDNKILSEKIEKAEQIERDNDLVIICPYAPEIKYVYTIEELNDKFQKFNFLNTNLKQMSDQESVSLFGNDVRYMYEVQKTRLLAKKTLDSDKEFIKHDIDDYREIINSESASLEPDRIKLCLRKLDCIQISESKTSNLLESVVSDKTINTIDDNLSSYNGLDNVPLYTPYFTPVEIKDLSDVDTMSSDELVYLNNYEKDCASGLSTFDSHYFIEKLRKLNEELSNTTNKDDIYRIKESMIKLGWNPSVDVNDNNLAFARNRIKKYINENYNLDIIDISWMTVRESDYTEYDGDISPIFISLVCTDTFIGKIINKVKDSTYSHASIGFEESLTNLYSFNMINGRSNGLSYESINDYVKDNPNVKLKVLALFVTKNQKERIKARLEYYINNRSKTKYDVSNLFNILFSKSKSSNYSLKMVCSEFVDTLLRTINIDISGKSNNLVAPSDFEKADKPKLYKVYEGLAKDYNKLTVKILVDTVSMDKKNLYKLARLELKEAVNILFNTTNLDSFKYMKIEESSDRVVDTIKEIHDLLTPESIIRESKKLPLRITDRGDVEVDLPIVIEEEYQKSHKLLLEYDKSKNINGMKEEISKLWYLNIIIERKLNNSKTKNDKKKELTKVRARILNDFKKYLKVIINIQEDFNFTEYFKKSDYNNKTISIDNSTLKWSGLLIKSLLPKK